MLETPQLQPFQATTPCPKCGTGAPSVPVGVAQFAGTMPVPGSIPPVVQSIESAAEMAGFELSPMTISPFPGFDYMKTEYCPGGQEPEKEKFDPMAKMVKGMAQVTGHVHADALAAEMAERTINICAGIDQEHLHKTCSRCGYEFLMRCKDAPA